MSAFNIKSTVLAQRDATPKVFSEGALARAVIKEAYGAQKVSSAGSDLNTAGTQIRLVQVPSTARLSSLQYCGTSTGTSALDIAAWYPTYVPGGGGQFLTTAGGTLISSSKFLTNFIIPDTNAVFTTAFPAVATMGPDVLEQPLWQMLGLSADPEIPIDLGIVVRTACAINGYVGLKATYVE
jgi:hypothetical protein